MVNILMSSVIKAVLVRVKKEIFYACSAGNFNQQIVLSIAPAI